ncbi:MAG: response regulator [Planctomycetota bacterium]|jgi:NarL family two-component system response regulator LiaR
MDGTPIRVLIVDDHMMVREGIKSVLHQFPGIRVVGEAVNGVDAVDKVREFAPDVVLMDLVMPEMNGIEATRRIKAASPRTCILALTSFSTDDLVFPALEAGAVGYLLKDAGATDLVRSIRQANRGESSLHPTVARKVLDGFRGTGDPQAKPESLTARESEVLELLTRGLTNQQIAKKLSVSQATVRTHVSHILAKLHMANRVQAAMYAVKSGLVNMNDAG